MPGSDGFPVVGLRGRLILHPASAVRDRHHVGQQPFRDGVVVREFQPAMWGWTPHYGLLEVRARMDLSPRSMAGVWMVGLEDEPTRCAEILIFEVFGDALAEDGDGPSAAVGMGLRPFRDPAITDSFEAPRVPIDVTEHHVYAADWRPGPGRLPGRRRTGEERRAGAGLPDADDGRRVRLPGS